MGLILETPRLKLREMSLTDLDFVATMLADPEVMWYYRKPLSREEALKWVQRQMRRYADHGHGLWLVLRRGTDEPIGQVGLVLQEVDSIVEAEIVYLIHRPFWRCGYATEAALATRDYAFGTLDFRRVISLVRPENVPSQGVARKLGMSPQRETDFRGLRHIVFAAHCPEGSHTA